MKKLISLIIYLFVILFSFYTSFSNAFYSEQRLLIENSLESNDNNYFLKFNSYYNDEMLNRNENINIYESYDEDADELKFIFIIKSLDLNDIVDEKYNDKLSLKLTGEDSYIIELSVVDYGTNDFILLELEKEKLIKEVGQCINKVQLLNFNGDVIVLEETYIDLKNTTKERLILLEKGYTLDEYRELYKIDDITPVVKNLCFMLACGVVVFSCIFIYDAIKNKK